MQKKKLIGIYTAKESRCYKSLQSSHVKLSQSARENGAELAPCSVPASTHILLLFAPADESTPFFCVVLLLNPHPSIALDTKTVHRSWLASALGAGKMVRSSRRLSSALAQGKWFIVADFHLRLVQENGPSSSTFIGPLSSTSICALRLAQGKWFIIVDFHLRLAQGKWFIVVDFHLRLAQENGSLSSTSICAWHRKNGSLSPTSICAWRLPK